MRKHVPIAIALHKRDLDICMTKEEMEEILEVPTIQKQRPCRVFLTTTFPKEEEAQVNIKTYSGSIQTERGLISSYFWSPLMKMKNVIFE